MICYSYNRDILSIKILMSSHIAKLLFYIKRRRVLVLTQSARKQQHSMFSSACLLVVQIHSINRLLA